MALRAYDKILTETPTNAGALFGRAKMLEKLSSEKQDNLLLEQTIDAYEALLTTADVDLEEGQIKDAALRCINRMRFKGILIGS